MVKKGLKCVYCLCVDEQTCGRWVREESCSAFYSLQCEGTFISLITSVVEDISVQQMLIVKILIYPRANDMMS